MEMLKNRLIELVRLFEGQRDEYGNMTEKYEENRIQRLAIELELKETFGLGEKQIVKMQKYLMIKGELIPSEPYKKYVLKIKSNI